MRNAFWISAETGALRIGDAILLQPDDTKREIEAQVAPWLAGAHAPTYGGWPTRDAIDREVAFVGETLVREMGISTGRMSWGEVWSHFDAKAFIAANGLRYRRA